MEFSVAVWFVVDISVEAGADVEFVAYVVVNFNIVVRFVVCFNVEFSVIVGFVVDTWVELAVILWAVVRICVEFSVVVACTVVEFSVVIGFVVDNSVEASVGVEFVVGIWVEIVVVIVFVDLGRWLKISWKKLLISENFLLFGSGKGKFGNFSSVCNVVVLFWFGTDVVLEIKNIQFIPNSPSCFAVVKVYIYFLLLYTQ